MKMLRSLVAAGLALVLASAANAQTFGHPIVPGIVKLPAGSGQVVGSNQATLPLFHETFNGSTIATDHWRRFTSTMTIGQGGGWITLNLAGDVATSTGANIQSYRTFPLYQSYPIVGEWRISQNGTPDPGTNSEWGFGQPPTLGTGATATSGVFFRLGQGAGANSGTAVAKLYGVVSYAGVEDTVVLLPSTSLPATGFHRYRIEVSANRAEFSLDEEVLGWVYFTKTLPVAGSSATAPVFVHVYDNAAVAASAARIVEVGEVSVYARDIGANKPWGATMTGLGYGAYQAPPNSGTPGQTAQWINSQYPASGSLSNTAATYTTLGGQYKFVAVNGAGTDYALFVYLNPAASDSLPGRTLYITGVRVGEALVDSAATAAVNTFQWAIGVGSTAASLATTDQSNANAYRRVALGAQTFPNPSPIGTIAAGFDVDFSGAPLVVNASQRVAIILKIPIGTAAATVVFRGTITVKGYFE